MSDDVQLPEPAADLLAAASSAVPSWLRRVTEQACRDAGVDPSGRADEIAEVVDRAAVELVAALADLLSTDVDEQRTTPLTLCRAATVGPTRFLERHGVPAPARREPGGPGGTHDPYGIAPAAWADVDPSLHEPGLRWGAWKAMTVLRRRREEGLR